MKITRVLEKDADTSEDYYSYTSKWFRRWAPFYNLIALPLSGIRSKVVDITGVKEGSRVLDVCTGTGSQAFAFGKRGCNVIGIDLSEDMLKVARRKNSYKKVRIEVADATKMPFEDGYFDVSCISFDLHDMPHEVSHLVLDEMKRVSKRVVVADYNIPKRKLDRWVHIHLIFIYESKYFKDFARRDLKELLQQHGLRVVKEAYGLIDFIKILVCEEV